MIKDKLEKISIGENGYLFLTYVSAFVLDGIIIHSALTKNYAAISYIPVMKEMFEYSTRNYYIKEKESKHETESLIMDTKELTKDMAPDINDKIDKYHEKLNNLDKVKNVNLNNSMLALSVGSSLMMINSPVTTICGLGVVYLSPYIMSTVDKIEETKFDLCETLEEVKEYTREKNQQNNK